MSLTTRMKKIEAIKAANFSRRLNDLSDDELKKIVGEKPNDNYADWLKTLTGGELETIRYDQPGADALRRKFDECH